MDAGSSGAAASTGAQYRGVGVTSLDVDYLFISIVPGRCALHFDRDSSLEEAEEEGEERDGERRTGLSAE